MQWDHLILLNGSYIVTMMKESVGKAAGKTKLRKCIKMSVEHNI